ncbi:MAG: hypothetical protein RMJ98_10510 [Myxococcales bacterium]|nr:hypothetical protein [Polyangiaceae bacterium]MDW8249718.1 hypothetical protein [Myxococcales bacterium]
MTSASPGTSGPFSVFRMAFAILGALLFGASTLVGLSTLLVGDYTTQLKCERASNACTLHFRTSTKQVSLADLTSVERRRDSSRRNRTPSQGLYAVYSSGQVDFLCAVPDTHEGAARLDALAAEATSFLGDRQRPSLDLRCQGKVASVADGVLMTSLSAVLAIASFITLFRGVRRLLGFRSS